MNPKKTKLSALLCATALVAAGTVAAHAIELPNTISWTAYDTGSGGYNQAVAIGSALRNSVGVNLRVLPGRNDVARQVPLRERRVDFSATGIGASYFAQEGVFEFGEREWGPQDVRVLIASNDDGNLGIGVAADTGVRTIHDLRGKRVAWVVGSPALNQNITAMLGFAGMTWDDVERVDFPGFGASWEGIVNNQVDAAFAATTSGQAYQLEASPRGLAWVVFPHDDEEGWERLQRSAPFFEPNMATEGAAITPENPHEGAAYPYPVLIAYSDQDESLVYNMTKAMVELFDQYSGDAPGANGWALERQSFTWAVPYHEGAIRYYREIGVWSDEAQAHNDMLIERQRVLREAWDEILAQDIPEDEFTQRWMELRAERLEEAGKDVVFHPQEG
ncbi:TAXI family TRAP transporter solute-binding subunit [Salinarimonas sp.]|uniref:TAXI family TRAP transporter solute-binding subunit n=1 Tax=Salinarimonas sp. TaxID=2766526 RepID=UPI00391CA15A